MSDNKSNVQELKIQVVPYMHDPNRDKITSVERIFPKSSIENLTERKDPYFYCDPIDEEREEDEKTEFNRLHAPFFSPLPIPTLKRQNNA